jgi:hypothetical protein
VVTLLTEYRRAVLLVITVRAHRHYYKRLRTFVESMAYSYGNSVTIQLRLVYLLHHDRKRAGGRMPAQRRELPTLGTGGER